MKATIDPVPWAAGEASDQTPEDKPAVPVSRSGPRSGSIPRTPGPGVGPDRRRRVGAAWSGCRPSASAASSRPARAGAAGKVDVARPALVGDPGRIVVPVKGEEAFRLEVAPSSAVLAAALPARYSRVMRRRQAARASSSRWQPARQPHRRRSRSSCAGRPGTRSSAGRAATVARAGRPRRPIDHRLRVSRRVLPDSFFDAPAADDTTDGQLGTARISTRRGIRGGGHPPAGSVARLRLIGASVVDLNAARHGAASAASGVDCRAPGASGDGVPGGSATGKHRARAAPRPCRTCSSARRGTAAGRVPASATRVS